MSVPTPHISAQKGEFAKTVLMPGDPLRAKFIAETFLEKARLVNNVRGIGGYTGFYQGKEVSVIAMSCFIFMKWITLLGLERQERFAQI